MDEGVFHDEIEIEDFTYDPEHDSFVYPCPCGDLFAISCDDLLSGEVVASCLSCSLILKVIYDEDAIEDFITQKKLDETNKNEQQATEVN